MIQDAYLSLGGGGGGGGGGASSLIPLVIGGGSLGIPIPPSDERKLWLNTDDLIPEARRNGETYLATQIQLAIAADQRAMTLGGILAAASSILLGFALSGSASPAAAYFSLALSGALAVSCALAFYSARPVAISPPGNFPSGWYEDLQNDTPLKVALREDLAVIRRSIEKNSRVIEGNGKWLKAAMTIAAVAVVLAPIIGLLL